MVALQYATRWTDLAVIASTVPPAWDRPVRWTLLVVAALCLGPVPRVGRGALLFLLVGVSTALASSGYMALPQIEVRPTREGSRLGPLSLSIEEKQSDAISDAGDSVECPVPTDELVHAAPETVGPPLLPCPAHGDSPGAVAVEAAVQLGAPVAGVGGGCGWVGLGWTLPTWKMRRTCLGRKFGSPGSGAVIGVVTAQSASEDHCTALGTASGAQPLGGRTGPCPTRLLGPSPTAVARGPAPLGFWGPAPWRPHGALPHSACGAQPLGGLTGPCPSRLLGPSPSAAARGPAPLGFWGPAPRRSHGALPHSASGAQPHGVRTGPCPTRLLGLSPSAVARGPAPLGFWGPAPR